MSVSAILASLNVDRPSSELFSDLLILRNKHMKSPSLAKKLINRGLVSKLVPLLDRPNSKIVDICLSILGNIMLEEMPRKQIRSCTSGRGGIPTIIGIVSTLSDECIVNRAIRTIANMAQDTKNCAILHSHGVMPLLVKTIDEVKSPKTVQVIVRAFRILSDSKDHRKIAVDSRAIAAVSKYLSSSDEDLLKAIVKCLAHFTHGISVEASEQIHAEDGQGLQRLTKLMSHENRSIWEGAMACVINLAGLDKLRPSLGNSGAVVALVDKVSSPEVLCEKELAYAVTALCLFCRESVNRMKLRTAGGLKLFVRILSNSEHKLLHERILNSLIQFSYDDLSLRVLQAEGLIPCLVALLEEHTRNNKKSHDCAVEICDESIATCSDSVDELLTVQDGDDLQEENQSKEEEFDGECLKTESLAVTASKDQEVALSGATNLSSGIERASKHTNLHEPEATSSFAQPRFRVNSPSYQAVQDEFEEMRRQTTAYSIFSWSFAGEESPTASRYQSPDNSPFQWRSSGYSPAYSTSPGSSSLGSPSSPLNLQSDAEHCYSPVPEFNYASSPSSTPEKGDKDESTEEHVAAFSPVEHFSDEEDDLNDNQETSAETVLVNSPPHKKKRREKSDEPAKILVPSSSQFKSIFSPSYSASFNSFNPKAHLNLSDIKSDPTAIESSHSKPECRKERNHEGWILQILSRLSQAERPHPNLCDLSTTQALFRYLEHSKKPLPRAGRILLRLSKNLHFVMACIHQRHVSWLMSEVDERSTMEDVRCKSCQELVLLKREVHQNVALLAESGYAEGQMCHILVRGILDEKQEVAISSCILVSPRKQLRNILIIHEGLEILIDILEAVKTDEKGKEETKRKFFSEAVLSASYLAGHLGVVAPHLPLDQKRFGTCKFSRDKSEKNLILKTDDSSELPVSKDIVSSASGVFAAMLGGGFSESQQSSVHLPLTSFKALTLLVHHLYGCRWCSAFKNLEVLALLELVSLSDKYLLPEFNKSVSHEIVQRCLSPDQVVTIYEKSLQSDYVLFGSDKPLAVCAVNYLMVGAMPHRRRVSLFYELCKSRMSSDFVDDINKTIREKLLETQ